MALIVDYQAIEDRAKLFDAHNQLVPKAQAVVFLTMLIGMGEITKENFQEFYRRVRIAESVTGALCQDCRGPCYITEEDVKRMIGLRANVFPEWSARRFETHMAKTALARCLERREAEESSRDSERGAGG